MARVRRVMRHDACEEPRVRSATVEPSRQPFPHLAVRSCQMLGDSAAPAMAFAAETFLGWLTTRAWQFTVSDGRPALPLG